MPPDAADPVTRHAGDLCGGWAGIVRDPTGDEGALAHLYRLLMVGQVPLIAAFLFTAVRRGFRQGLLVFGLQIALWISALAAVPILGL